ncbi:FAD-binding oxidoreductase [Herpetosiphon giganteus]|uniref:NAD(P)/FAD-dependent oxidoreductase n=1 Tax=Herpetosiphon giganteus TaxID=2029754 RepID=UPI0030846457
MAHQRRSFGMVHQAQVVIIGAGIIGASVAYHLAARGCTEVVVLEKEAVEVTGSTARSAAGVRHQFSSRTNILLSQYSIERYKHFTEEIGGHAELHQHGYLFLFNDQAAWQAYQAVIELQQSLKVPVEVLTPEQAAGYIPELNISDLVGATYCAEDGFVDPHGIAMGYLNKARALGVKVLRDAPALGFEFADDQVVAVQTPQGSIRCNYVVNAAGPYAGEVGKTAGFEIPIKPYRRCIYVSDPFPALPKDIPLTIDVGTGAYIRKEQDTVLMGLSNHNEPSSHDTTVDWDWLDTVLEAMLNRFPILERAGLSERQSWAGSYEITPDHLPILGRMPNCPNWLNAAGFSGHGVMHAPATGLLIAEEILDGRAHSIDIDELRIERFAAGELHAERNVI